MDNYGYQAEDHAVGRTFAIARYPSSNIASNQYLVGVNTRAKVLKKPVFYQRISCFLLVLALVLLIGLIVLIILYTKPKQKLCISTECLRSASNLKLSIDLSVDPCDNFYSYTCGKWSEEHPNHGWYKSFSNFETISEKIILESISFLTSDAGENEPKSIEKARNFYKSCMDTESLENLGYSVVYKYLKLVNLPEVPTFLTKISSDDFNFDWIKSEALIKRIFAMDVFIGFLVQPNLYNNSQNVMYIGTPVQDCPLPSPLRSSKINSNRIKSKNNNAKDDEDETLIEVTRATVFKFVAKEILKNATSVEPDEDILNNAAKIINEISGKIQDLALNYTTTELESDGPNAMSFKDLQEKVDTSISQPIPNVFVDYVNNIFEKTNVSINPQVDILYIEKIEEIYLSKILDYLTNTPDINIELYLWWVSVYAMIMNTSSDVIEYISKVISILDSPTESDVPVFVKSRSLECSALTNEYMDLAMSYALSDRSFPNTTRPKVETMLAEIKEAFVEHVRHVNWMDDYTKQVTLEKSEEMISFIGFPDWLFEEGVLDEHYKSVDIKSDTFLDNMMQIINMKVEEQLNSLRDVNVRDWKTKAIRVNAFNSFVDNAINVPMAILKYPIYNLGLEEELFDSCLYRKGKENRNPDDRHSIFVLGIPTTTSRHTFRRVLNYGSIGSILGHELTHGFDNLGRKHDKYGNYIQWWSNATIETFENLTECFVKQYDNFTIEGVDGHVKGKETLGENLADNGGINQAFTAYKKYVKRFGEEPSLPGFENYSNDQLFFIAYASIWCENISPDDLETQLEYDEHSPNHIRVLGTLQNSEEFSNAFSCPKGSNMNPERKKCKIW